MTNIEDFIVFNIRGVSCVLVVHITTVEDLTAVSQSAWLLRLLTEDERRKKGHLLRSTCHLLLTLPYSTSFTRALLV